MEDILSNQDPDLVAGQILTHTPTDASDSELRARANIIGQSFQRRLVAANKWRQAQEIAKNTPGESESDDEETKELKQQAAFKAMEKCLADVDRENTPLGRFDRLGTMWKQGGFKTSAEAFSFMSNLVLKGPEAGLTEDYKEFYALDYDGQVALARKNRGLGKRMLSAAGDLADAIENHFQTPSLGDAELRDAPEDVIAANELLRERDNRQRIATAGKDPLGMVATSTTVPQYEPDEKTIAAEKRINEYRQKREDEAIRSEYAVQLNRKNAWSAFAALMPTMTKEAQTLAQEMIDSPNGALPVKYQAAFENLDEKEQSQLILVRQLLKEHVDSGVMNTIGDALIGAGNITLNILTAPYRQGAKIGNMFDNTVFDAGIDVNELARQRQRLWQVSGDFFSGSDQFLETGMLPQMQIEQICEDHGVLAEAVIGAVSTLPYMYAASIGGGKFTKLGSMGKVGAAAAKIGTAATSGTSLVALEAMQEFDDHTVMNGGDITDPRYIVSSFLMGGLYAYIEKMQVDKLLGGISEQRVREGMLKGFWAGMKNGTVPRVLFAETMSESLQEGLQNAVMAMHEAWAVGERIPRATVEGFIEDFVGSLGTMAIIGAGGIVKGHMGRSGWHFRGNGMESAAELRQAERSSDLTSIYLSKFARNNMVKAGARTEAYRQAAMGKELSGLKSFWNEGGKAGLIEKGGVSERAAEKLDEFFTALKAAEGSELQTKASAAIEEWNKGRGVEASPKAGEKGDIGQHYLENLLGEFYRGGINEEDFIGKLVNLGFSEEGARAYTEFGKLDREAANKGAALSEFLRGRYERKYGTEEAYEGDKAKVRAALENLDRARSIWAQGQGVYYKGENGKTQDPGAKALEEFGFTKDDAEKLSRMFHYERAAAYSKIALDGIRAMYERATKGRVTGKAALASEFKGRVERLEVGTDAKGKKVYGDFIRFELPKGRGSAYVQIVESPTGAPDFTKANKYVANSIVEATKNHAKPVTAKEWIDATPEEREKIWNDHHLYDEGVFSPDEEVCLQLKDDPSVKIDSTGAKRLVFGTITLANEAGHTLGKGERPTLDNIMTLDSSVGFHEVYHAWERFMKATGQWTEAEEKALAKKYGKNEDGKHNDEAAANAMRSYMNRRIEGRMTAEDEASPFKKIYALARKLIRREEEKKVKERIAANAEEAFFDQIIADNYRGIGSLGKKSEVKPGKKAETPTATAPQMPGRKDNAGGNATAPQDNGGKPEEGAEGGAPAPAAPAAPAKPAATPKPAAQTGWTAYTPTGNVKVSGYYAVVNLKDVIHSNNPAYALYMRAQLRNRKDNKAEEDTRKNIVNNFQGERLLEAPDTANGAPIVFIAPDENGVNRMFVLSGNGRVLVLNELAEKHMYDKYRNVMKAWAAENGLEVPEGETPILVRVITDFGGATREKVADLSNTNSIQQYTEEEQARADAEVIKALGIARLYHANKNGTADMTPGVNDDFFSEFIRGVGDSALYNSDRSLTETARIRAVRALLAISVGQGDRGRDVVKKLIEQTDTLNIQRQKNAAAIMAAAVAALETNDNYSIGPDVSRAMAEYIDFAEKKKAGKIGTFNDFYAQMDLLDGPSELAREILALFGSKQSAEDIAEYVTAYCETAANEDPTGGLFGAEAARDRMAVWKDVKRTVEERRVKERGEEKHSIKAADKRRKAANPAEWLGRDPWAKAPWMKKATAKAPVEVTKNDLDAALKKYGKAEKASEAVYALPDGTLMRGKGVTLNFGGKVVKSFGHDGFTDDIMQRVQGNRKAKSISDLAAWSEDAKRGIAATGAIRMASDGTYLEIFQEPTEGQYDAFYDIVYGAEALSQEFDDVDEVKIDVSTANLDNIFSVSYRIGTSPRRIIDDLRGWYRYGELPLGATGAAAEYAKTEPMAKHSISGVDFTATAKYYQGDIRNMARMIKRGDASAIRYAAETMARYVKDGSVLVPVPGHGGMATDTLALANEISMITGSPVVDALKGIVRESVYDMKAEGYLPTAEELGFYQAAKLPEGREIVLIDDVVGTGTTAVAAREALGAGSVLAFAWDHTAPKPIGIVGGMAEEMAEYGEEHYSIRSEEPPKRTGIGYKLFVKGKDGGLYPPMVANPDGAATPVGVWLNADEGKRGKDSKTGRKRVKSGGKGTNGGSGDLAWRPGWHLGEIPYALQFNVGEKVDNPLGITNKDGEIIKVGRYFPANFVWGEVEYAADVDYQEEAMSYGNTASGKFNHALAGLPRIPVDGSYKYRTNANPATDPWIITGAMKVNRILSNEEVDDLVRKAGRQPQERIPTDVATAKETAEEREAVKHSLFAGEKLATPKKLEALAKAKAMLGDNDYMAHRVEIFAETGWFKGADGKWRVELPPIKAKNIQGLDGIEFPDGESIREKYGLDEYYCLDLEDVVTLPPGMRKSFATLNSVHVFFVDKEELDRITGEDKNTAATFVDFRNTIFGRLPVIDIFVADALANQGKKRTYLVGKTMRSLTHEIQHVIQLQESFAFGGNVSNNGDSAYTYAAGEVEARNAARRRDPEYRLVAPWVTEDAPRMYQNVGYSGWDFDADDGIWSRMPSDSALAPAATARTAAERHSFAIGEVGASNLQNALFVSANLAKARQLVGNKDWAKIPRVGRLAIKFMTGWEKGADGKWRLEQPSLPDINLKKFKKTEDGKYEPTTIGKIFPKAEIFQAYPWLKTTEVQLGVLDPEGTTRGQLEDRAGKFVIKLRYGKDETPETLKQTITHELQHQVQHIEDFARGGNMSIARHLFVKKYEEAAKEARPLFLEAFEIEKKILSWQERMDFRHGRRKSAVHLAARDKLRENPEWLDYERRCDEFKRKWGHQVSFFMEGSYAAMNMAFKRMFKDYTKFAGEVEARNVAKREMTTDTLLEDTEDVDRRYQKLVNGALEEFERIKEADEAEEKHSFAGLRGGRIVGIDKLDDAELMEMRGADREYIWRVTGWYRGRDGMWRVELPFHGRFVFEGDFDDGLTKGYRTVSDYFEWPELFEAYPEMKEVEVKFEDMPEDTRGDFDPKTKTIRINNSVRKGGDGYFAKRRVVPVMIHEIQHAIQSIENHARGGDPEEMLTWDHARVYSQISKLEAAKAMTTDKREQAELDAMIDEFENNLKEDREAALDRYYALAGEVEARNAADRFYRSPSWRLEHPPWETEDVQREKQLISFNEEDDVHWDNVAVVENGDEKYSIVADREKNLIAVHGLTVNSLKKAISAGGLVSPSAAIVDADEGFTKPGYIDDFNIKEPAQGKVFLLFPKDVIDAPEMDYYDGDAYTPNVRALGGDVSNEALALARQQFNDERVEYQTQMTNLGFIMRKPVQQRTYDTSAIREALKPIRKREGVEPVMDWLQRIDEEHKQLTAMIHNAYAEGIDEKDALKAIAASLNNSSGAEETVKRLEETKLFKPEDVKALGEELYRQFGPEADRRSLHFIEAKYWSKLPIERVTGAVVSGTEEEIAQAVKILDEAGVKNIVEVPEDGGDTQGAIQSAEAALGDKFSFKAEITHPWGLRFTGSTYMATDDFVGKDTRLAKLRDGARAGNLNSALQIVDELLPTKAKTPLEDVRLERIRQIAAEHPNATLLPVMTDERGGNLLPFIYAKRIADITGLKVSDGVREVAREDNEALDAILRPVEFDGGVMRNHDYIMVGDDTDLDGAFGSLRRHVSERGGRIVAATSLTISRENDTISPREATLQQLFNQFGETFAANLRKAGIANEPTDLTEQQARRLSGYSRDAFEELARRAFDYRSQARANQDGAGEAGRLRATLRPGSTQPSGDPSQASKRVERLPNGRSRSGRPATFDVSEVLPTMRPYYNQDTRTLGNRFFAKADIIRGEISQAFHDVIDALGRAPDNLTGDEQLALIKKAFETIKATKEGKLLFGRLKSGDSYHGTEAEEKDPARRAIWDMIEKEIALDPITAKNSEALELDRNTKRPKAADVILRAQEANPDLPKIRLDADAQYTPLCDRRIDIVIGPPAAGKSSVFVDLLSVYHRSRVFDSDAIKKRLPGFDKGNGASFVHEESSTLNKKIIKRFLDRNTGENVVLPIVGASVKSVKKYVDQFRAAGYTIYLHNNYIPIQQACFRAMLRTLSTGRLIVPEVFLNCMDAPSAVFEQMKGEVDFWDMFDNNGMIGEKPLYVQGNYTDEAYGGIVTKEDRERAEAIVRERMKDPQLMLDFANALDEQENPQRDFFMPRMRQSTFDFSEGSESKAKHAIRSDLRENRDKAANEALTNWITYFRLSHGSVPMTKTIVRMGLAMGMSSINAQKILKASETRAEQMRGTLIERAAANGDIATTMALLKREDGIDETIDNMLAGGVAKGGELTHRGVGQINTIIKKRVEQMMHDFTAASLADMEGETGLDIAAEILANNPDAFADEIKGAKGTDPNKPTDEGEEGSDTDAPGGDGGGGEEGLSDYERYEREKARREALKKVEDFIAKAKAKAEENRRKAEERRQRMEDGGGDIGGTSDGTGGDPSAEDMEAAINQSLKANPKNVKANFKTKEEFAAFMRVWAEYKFDRTHGHSSLGKAEKDKLFAEFYRITVRQELQDLADKLLAPKDENGATISRIAKLGNGSRNHVSRMIARLEKGLRADTIERMSGDIFAFINAAAVRVSRTDLVNEFKKEIKAKYIKGANYEDLKLDTDRRVTGWVEEAARYICRVCDLSKRGINGDISQLAAERKELLDIINRRADVYDESGKEVARAAVEDMETKKAMWKLALLEKYGAMTSLMPGEILDLRQKALDYLENEAGKLEQLWQDTRAYEESIRKDLQSAIVAPNGQRYQEKGWLNGRLFDALNGLIRLRLQHLTRFASGEAQATAKEAINKILVMLGDGEVQYNRMLQDDRQALFEGLAHIFQRPNGGADNSAIKKYLNRMTEAIPAELAAQLSKQGFGDSMTYGQMLQLLVSLEQRSFKDAIEHNGREGQAALIRNYETVDEKGNRQRVFTEQDNQFIEWLRAFYAAKREIISPVTKRMVGQEVDSPDPLYCPIKRSMEDRVQALAEAGSTWDPIAAVFSRRVKNNRDFDEQASIIGMFFDRSNETAKLVAWAERGTVIRGIFTNVGLQGAIRRAFGPGELRKIMTQLLATFNGGESKSKSPGELAAVDKALNFTTYAYLGFNPLSSAKQTTSFTVWANALPGGFRDLWRYMTHFDAKALKHLKESDEYKVRYGNEVGSGQDLATKGLNENPSMNPVVRMISGAGMWMLKKGDFAPGGWIAQGLYKDLLDKHLREGMEFEEADKLAITETFNMLEETQQSGRVYNTNMLTLEHGRIGRLLTQFATSPLQQLQYETQAYREWRDMVRYNQGEKKIAAARQKLVRAAVINHLLLPAALNFVTAVYKSLMGDEPPWEQDGYHWTLLTEILLGQFSRVFFIGAFAQTSLKALFAREYPRGSQILPVEGALGMAASLCITAHDVATLDAEKIHKDIERLLKATAPTRIPYNLFRRITGDSDVDRKRAEAARKQRKH